jgi:hypothetical protein
VREVFVRDIPASVAVVRDHLTRTLFEVGDLWLPTRGELHRWHESVSPLYIRWVRHDIFEIGPRLETLPAARLAPVLRGTLRPTPVDHTAFSGRLSLPRSTLIVYGLVALMMAGWGAVTLTQFSLGATHAGWVGTWVVSVVILIGGPGAAFWFGRRELTRALPWLEESIQHMEIEDPW